MANSRLKLCFIYLTRTPDMCSLMRKSNDTRDHSGLHPSSLSWLHPCSATETTDDIMIDFKWCLRNYTVNSPTMSLSSSLLFLKLPHSLAASCVFWSYITPSMAAFLSSLGIPTGHALFCPFLHFLQGPAQCSGLLQSSATLPWIELKIGCLGSSWKLCSSPAKLPPLQKQTT